MVRFLAVFGIAVVVGGLAGLAGHSKEPKVFESTGLIHVLPVAPGVLFNSAGVMPMYEQFVQMQVMLLKSERCVDMAMNSPKWLAGGARSSGPGAAASFQANLSVDRDGEIIRVQFRSPDPRTAQDAVGALIDAYQSLAIDIDPDQPVRRQAKLEQLKGDYEGRLETARNDIGKLADPYLPSTLLNKYEYKMTESNQAETDYRNAQRAVEEWKILHAEPAAPAVDVDLVKLEAKMELYATRWKEMQQETIDFGHRVARIKQIEAEQAQNTKWLAEVKQALEQLRVQVNSGGRILVISNGDRPVLLPNLRWALVSGIGGFLVALAAGLILLRPWRA